VPADDLYNMNLLSARLAQVRRYVWDIDPGDADHPTIHGWRGTGILARAEQDYEVDQIPNDIGMSAKTSSTT
jgi:hypothetical protein